MAWVEHAPEAFPIVARGASAQTTLATDDDTSALTASQLDA